MRFVKVSAQTIGAPVVMAVLFFAIFDFSLGDATLSGGVPFLVFLAPGLMMMAILQNAFANTSSSLLTAKMQGNIVDFLMPPLSPFELVLALAAGGVTRGLAVGVATGLALWCWVELALHDAGTVLLFAVLASAMLALAGTAAGIAAEKFEHASTATNFVVVPLSFLSGTYYSIDGLPAFWQGVAHANPFFYAIDGIRFGLTGAGESDPATGLAVVAGVTLALGALCYRLFAAGVGLRD
jgi:ABC-2 type transport system permease protein